MSSSQTEKIECDILIVGAGIAGAALACGVRDRGYRVVQVELSDRPLDTARGDHFQCVVVEILEQWGALQAFWDAGAEKRHGAKYLTDMNDLILDVDHASMPVPHPYYLYLHHELIGQTFLALAAQNPNYTLFRPVVIKPRLVVGADGRSSRVRDVLNFDVHEHNYENPLVVLFARRTENDPLNRVSTFMSAHGSVSRIPRAFGGWKIGLPIRKADIAFWKTSTSKMRKSAIVQRAPQLENIEAELSGFYPVKLLNTSKWVSGNTVLVGDACHAMHPARGQGMNLAIRCIAKLMNLLPDVAEMDDIEIVTRRLRAYESGVKPAIDKVLAENHVRGEEMDSLDASIIARSAAALRVINADPELLRRYRLKSAGYADPLSSPSQV